MVSLSRRKLVLTSEFLGGLTDSLVPMGELEQPDDRSCDSTDHSPHVTKH